MTRKTVTLDRLDLAAISAGLADQIALLEERIHPRITARLEPDDVQDATALDAFNNALVGLRMVREQLLTRLGV